MFKIVKNRRAWWPVEFGGVTEEGRPVTNKVELRFFIHSETENMQFTLEIGRIATRATELVDEHVRELGAEAEVSEDERARLMVEKFGVVMAELMERMACDWREVGAENGDPLRFEREHILTMVNVPGFFSAATEAYGKCRVGNKGEKGAREGN